MTRVKVCGVTRPEDARAAVELGASALGFVFWAGSPRCIDADRARAIVAMLPPFVVPVGVFVNEAPGRIQQVVAQVGLGAVQLHGDEPPDVARGMPRPVLRAVSPERPDVDAQLDAWPDPVLPVLDVHDPVRRGGTGRRVDWSRAAAVAARRRVLLAGGLSPLNVRDAILSVRPWGVDVSSGVETAPGVKDPDRLRAFFRAVRDADDELARIACGQAPAPHGNGGA